MIIFQYRIYRSDLTLNPDVYYCFGDNDDRIGLGGQAAEMRGESNAIGIRTKKSPGHADRDFYKDEEFDECARKIDEDFAKVEVMLKGGRAIVFPTEGFGTGLSELKKYAPKLLEYIEETMVRLADEYTVMG